MDPFRILFIDSYDSFTYNITRLLEHGHDNANNNNPIQVITIHNDTFTTTDQLIPYLPLFNCIVLGPGPGNPVNGASDIGIIEQLLGDERFFDVPILGICLGFQAMCYLQGANIEELETIKHGQVYPITVVRRNSDSLGLFDGYPATFKATRYHSLHVTNYKSNESKIIPLAYTVDENGELLMACKIDGKPWYGVQYHPESCCSELGGQLVSNFLRLARGSNLSGRGKASNEETTRAILELNRKIDKTPIFDKGLLLAKAQHKALTCELSIKEYKVTRDPEFTVALADRIKRDKFVLSSGKVLKNRGEWSIIALPERNTSVVLTHYETLGRTTIYKWQDSRLTHSKLNQYLQLEFDGDQFDDGTIKMIKQDKHSFWDTMGSLMEPKIQMYLESNNGYGNDLPFVGGLIGVLGYEMGSFVKSPSERSSGNKRTPLSTHLPEPDAKLVYIETCIVIDHRRGTLYTISPKGNNEGSIDGFPIPEFETLLNDTLQNQVNCDTRGGPLTLPGEDIRYDILLPERTAYADAFNRCQEFMHRGDSYEICLTTQTVVRPTRRLDPWRLFQTLTRRNPAPFESFFVFNDLHVDTSNGHQTQAGSGEYNDILCLVSTSPERFLRWDKSTCELRPVKGTVKKSADMTYQKAANILRTPKEFGENLMILDLIRNDLHELIPRVEVEEFMAVEEYETVYQLVSVVKAYGVDVSPYSGIDILKHSLPPGSMTGAPKKATVELLQDHLENALNRKVRSDGTRGIYSGVTGYWSINGNGDWSVNIRCCYSYTNGLEWYLGAGGAITVLSTLEGELDEMYTKLDSNLQVF